MEPHWILVTFKDSTRVAGYCGRESFISSDPSERDIYIERVYDVDDNGTWIPIDPKRHAHHTRRNQHDRIHTLSSRGHPRCPAPLVIRRPGVPHLSHGQRPPHAPRHRTRVATNPPAGPPLRPRNHPSLALPANSRPQLVCRPRQPQYSSPNVRRHRLEIGRPAFGSRIAIITVFRTLASGPANPNTADRGGYSL